MDREVVRKIRDKNLTSTQKETLLYSICLYRIEVILEE